MNSLRSRRAEFVQLTIDAMKAIAPPALSASWDNTGLLLDPPTPLEYDNFTIFLTNDLTEKVMSEAIERKASMIVTYHPTPFRAQKRFTRDDPVARIVLAAASERIPIYSPHTSLDGAVGGINEWICKAFNTSAVVPITPASDAELAAAGAGDGRIATLTEPQTLERIIQQVKDHFLLAHVRVGMPMQSLEASKATPSSVTDAAKSEIVRSVAVCAGSGASMLLGVDADVYLTGEMSHHEVLAASVAGKSVILTEHSNCERGFLPHLAEALRGELNARTEANNFSIIISDVDADPLVTV